MVDTRNPARFLLWIVSQQRSRIAAGAILGTLSTVCLAVPPYLLSHAIDDGLRASDNTALIGWTTALFLIGALNAFLLIARHRTMSRIRMNANFQIVEETVRHATQLGASLPSQITAGEVIAIGMSDVQAISQALTITGPGVGAVVTYAVIAVLLFSISPPLAVIVLIGVPLLTLTIGPLLRRIQRSTTNYREQQGMLTARLLDMMTGLRILNGLGGKQAHAARYRRDSQALCTQGYRVGAATSWVGALGTGLPSLFLAIVTWLAARMAAEGTLSIGNLIAVYGYVAVLVVPVSSFIEGGTDLTRALVTARRVTNFLNLASDNGSRDPLAGIEIQPGLLTAIVGELPHNLSHNTASQSPQRILIADNDAYLFAGTVRDVITGRHEPDDDAINHALHVAVADDIVDALPDGLDSMLTAQGRNLSGGQRQRIRLARAVYANPEVLLAFDPTSAVDAHTEAEMVSRLKSARAGRTTILNTSSPAVLSQADKVIRL